MGQRGPLCIGLNGCMLLIPSGQPTTNQPKAYSCQHQTLTQQIILNIVQINIFLAIQSLFTLYTSQSCTQHLVAIDRINPEVMKNPELQMPSTTMTQKLYNLLLGDTNIHLPLSDFPGEVYSLPHFPFQVVPLATVFGKPFPGRNFSSHTVLSKQ